MARIKHGAGCSFRLDERGASALEFALVAPVLFVSLFALIEIGMLGMISSGVDNAVADAARRIRTGREDAANSAVDFEGQVCARLGGDEGACRARLVVSVQRFSSFTSANTAASAQPDGAFNKGAAGDIILVKANYTWSLVTPLLALAFNHSGPQDVTIASRTAFKNEPVE